MTYELLACESAYAVYGRQEVSHARIIWSGAVDNIQFDVMRHDNLHCVVVAFAGTNELKDWGRHVFVRRRKLAGIGGLVHRGWLSDWRKTQSTFIGAVREAMQHNDDLLICGHSYGGSMAQLAAATAAVQMVSGDRIHLYTFGAPRLGNKKFARQLDGLIPRHFRHTIKTDPVPHLPLGIRYKHAGMHVLHPHNPRPHAMASYLEALGYV